MFVVSRFTKINGIKNYVQDMDGPGSPYQTREEAEVHLKRGAVIIQAGRVWLPF
jgi:hypothetical protein